MQERKDKAVQLSQKLEEARSRFQELEEAKEYVNSVYAPNVPIHHTRYGDGVIRENSGTIITVDFTEIAKKQFGTFVAAANGLVSVDIDGYAEKLAAYRDILKKESSIKTGLSYSERG